MADPTKSNGATMEGRNPNGTFKEGHQYGFKPGQSGNPKGRKNAISDIFNELLDASDEDRTVREAIAERMITIAMQQELEEQKTHGEQDLELKLMKSSIGHVVVVSAYNN